MKRIALLFVVLAAVAIGVVMFGRSGGGGAAPGAGTRTNAGPSASATHATPTQPGPASQRAPVVRKTPVPPKEPIVIGPMVAHAEQLNEEGRTAEEDLEVVGELIQAYIRYIGTGPEGGLNDEIVASLQGSNPMKMILLGKGHQKINEAGELLDRFGTPYYFHPVSSKEIEIRSAGPDKVLWSKDDVLLE